MISLIVAKADNGVIGKGNDLPWYLPADLKHFKHLTLGHPVIMGRRTYESILARLQGPLPGRRNIVVSRTKKSLASGYELAGSIGQALDKTRDDSPFIIGGAQLFQAVLDDGLVDRLYVTEVHADIAGDTLFPVLDYSQWQEAGREDLGADDKNPYNYSFVILNKKMS